MALNVKPIGDRILVEPVEEKETKKGGIINSRYRQGKTHGKRRHRARHGQDQRRRQEASFEVKKGDRCSSPNTAARKSS